MATPIDNNLLDALTKAYTARALLFHKQIRASGIDLLLTEIDAVDSSELNWGNEALGVSQPALDRLTAVGASPHQVFAHPSVIAERPYLVTYYRNLVTLSKKGISQLGFPTERWESRRADAMEMDDAVLLCAALNRILGGVIEAIPDYDVRLSREAILAELGTEIQGTWANVIGGKATKAVEGILADFIEQEELGERTGAGSFALRNGWIIRFANEPDVAFTDSAGVNRIVIEIKGSLDRAGAQTRYGEAKKSFAKELDRNPRCHTVYLASCFTDAVVRQIRSDGQVRDWFNLTSILYDPRERDEFLKKLFHLAKVPE